MNSIEFPLLDPTAEISVISTTLNVNDLSNWSRLSSLWPLLYGFLVNLRSLYRIPV